MSFDVLTASTLRLAFDPETLAERCEEIAKAARLAGKDDCLSLVIKANADCDTESNATITVESLDQGKELVKFNSWT